MSPLFILISMIALQGPAPQPKADAPPPATGSPAAPGLDARLDALDRKIAVIKDLAADFEQTKKSALLRKPLVSEGTIRLKGPRTRWNTVKPHPTAMTIDASEVRIYYPEQKTVEVYPVQGDMARLAASPLPRMSIVREQFEIAEIKPTDIDPAAKGDMIAIALTPKSDVLKEHLQRVRVLIDASTACAKTVEMTDADGDQTTIRFANIRLDSGISDKDVELVIPPGTSVSRPLEGEKPKPSTNPSPKPEDKK